MENNIKTWKEIIIKLLLMRIISPFVGLMLTIALFPDGGSVIYTIAMAFGAVTLAGIFNILKAIFLKFKGGNEVISE